MKAYFEAWRRYADFSGITSRRDFWMALFSHFCFGILYCFCLILLSVLMIANSDIETETLILILRILMSFRDLAFTVPCIAMTVRRLRDAGFSAGSFLWLLVPVLGMIAFFARLCEPSKIPEPEDSGVDAID